MRPLQKIGLGLFVASFAVFVLTLGMGKYVLTHDVVEQVVDDPVRQEVLQTVANGMYGTEYRSQFAFVAALEDLFDRANQSVENRFGLSEAEVQALIDRVTADGQVKYSREDLDAAFPAAEDAEKVQALNDNTSWLYGREYQPEDFQATLMEKRLDINRSIIAARGFQGYDAKTYKRVLTKSSTVGVARDHAGTLGIIGFLLTCLGALMYIVPQLKDGPAGIKNNGTFFTNVMNRGWIGISLGAFLIGFYILLYKFPEYITNWELMLDPVSNSLSGNPADQWFLYGVLYCLAMTVMGVRMLIKYRHNRYQVVRTLSVLFFQIVFAFTLPQILKRLNLPSYDLKSAWPLEYTFFFDYRIDEHLAAGNLGFWMLGWGIALFLIGVPVITYFFGKRWYCSWVCGCGGLAETLGDPFRHQSDKSLKSWKIERWSIHAVLVFAVIMTVAVAYTWATKESTLLGISSYDLRSNYGFMIGFVFAGVVGTGFYPLMGNRMWCRFGCPLAAYLGIVQRFKSRFRITTNGGQCISCGNCSTYCEQGIDVRWYAQRGQNIVRSSCVGCGICSAVCPRGVLKLENGPEQGRINDNPILIGNDGVSLNEQAVNA